MRSNSNLVGRGSNPSCQVIKHWNSTVVLTGSDCSCFFKSQHTCAVYQSLPTKNRCYTVYLGWFTSVIFCKPRMVCPKLCAKLIVFPWCSYIGPASKPVRLFTLKKCYSNMLMLTTSNATCDSERWLHLIRVWWKERERNTTHDIISNNQNGYQHAGILNFSPSSLEPPKKLTCSTQKPCIFFKVKETSMLSFSRMDQLLCQRKDRRHCRTNGHTTAETTEGQVQGPGPRLL